VRLIALAATVLVFARGGYDHGALFATAGPLTHLPYSVWSPIVSADRRRIEFGWSTKSGRPGGVGVMNADGTHARKIATGCYPGGWGSGDAWLAVDCSGRLTVLSPDGSHRRKLAAMPANSSAKVRPGTSTIFFGSLDGFTYEIASTGGKLRRVALGWAEAWTSDGRSLLVSVPDNGVLRLDTIDAAGGDRKTVMRLPTWSTEFTATWSPDGTQLAYAGSSNRPNDLFVVRADGTHRRRLTHTGDVGEPGWLR
jgi:WD40 repeat protein